MYVSIRTACPKDAMELKRLNDAFNGKDSNTLEGIRAGLAREDAETVFVADAGGHLAGFLCAQLFKSVCYASFYVEITELYVDEGARRQGVGHALMRFAEDWYRREGIHDFQLFTGAGNATAQAFYAHAGYRPHGDILYRKRDCWLSSEPDEK